MSQNDATPHETPPGDPLVGTLVGGRYRIERKLGEGGMGTVYRAVHEALRKPVAVKVLSGRGSSDKAIVARFEREAIAAANLRHPNIADATDFGRLPDGSFYLVMEYIEGRTLRAVLDGSPRGLPPERALGILRQVAAALARAHAMEIVHRDLKPENVIVFDLRDTRDAIKVIDFGIARIRDAFGAGRTALTVAGAIFGTPEYMAPEQVLGEVVDGRSDQYAFGVMAFELLTGKVPFSGAEPAQILMKHVNAPIPDVLAAAPHLPPAVGPALARLLAKRRDDRFLAIEQAYHVLETALSAPVSSGGTVLLTGPVQAASAGVSGALSGAPPGAPGLSPGLSGASAAVTGVSADASGASAAVTGPSPGVSGAPAAVAASPAAAQEGTPAPYAPAITGGIRVRRPGGAAAAVKELVDAVRGFVRDNSKDPRFLFGALGALGLFFVLVTVLVVWRLTASSLPGDVEDALERWEEGAHDAAEPVLRAELLKKPSLATDPALFEPLIAAAESEKARRALASLMSNTALGRSAPMVIALADLGLQEASPTRNGALKLLRGRLELLPPETRARIALRDAGDCLALQRAVADLAGAGGDAEDDAKRFREGQCRKLLRRDELCGCPPPAAPRPRGKKGK